MPIRQLWLNRVFTDLANSHEKNCLTIDCGYINQNGPGRFRSHAENPEKQVCYFNKPNEDKFYNVFISRRIKGDEFNNKIYFQIERLRGRDATENLVQRKHYKMAQAELDEKNYQLTQSSKAEQEQNDLQTLMSTFSEEIGSQLDLDFSTNDNDVQFEKTTQKNQRSSNYSSTKVKARNLLTNVSYR